METPYQSDAQAVQRDPRAQARETAPRIPVPTNGERLTRRRRTQNPLDIDRRIIPAGMSYEWKRVETAGQRESAYLIGLRENHWKEVPASRHPEMAFTGDTHIRRGDCVLFERPKYLTEDAQMENLHEALEPVQNVDEILYGTPPGELTRNHPSVRNLAGVRQQWAPGDPVEEAPAGGGLASEP